MATPVKIRGIYSTALTRLLLDGGYAIADPSPEIQERFALASNRRVPVIFIKDQEDHHGVEIFSDAEAMSRLLANLQGRLLDAALLKFEPLAESEIGLLEELHTSKELTHARLEFGSESKRSLDLIRSSVVPSSGVHHRFRIINPKKLEKAEKQIAQEPGLKEDLDRALFQEMVLTPLSKAEGVKLEHIKLSGKHVRPREGTLMEIQGGRILVRRSFSRGRYEGLNLPIEEGDYGITAAQEGSWQVKHSYFSKGGRLKGEYYNINTPVELYPFGARYLDLEIDVVRRADGNPFIVDREDLAVLSKTGCISPALEKKALETAEDLLKEINEARASEH